MGNDLLLLSKNNSVGWITFNDPRTRNSLSNEMCADLILALADLEADPEIRVCVLQGGGHDAFASGANIGEFRTGDSAPSEPPPVHRMVGALERFSKPMIAMVRGWCLGGGLIVAMKADMRIADTTAKFGVPAAKLGIGYPLDPVRDLMDLVGPARAKAILYTAENLDAQKALAWGLVEEVHPPEALIARVEQLAETISRNAPLSVRAATAAVDHLVHARPPKEEVNALLKRCFNSSDFVEGRAAFREKRKPNFRGI